MPLDPALIGTASRAHVIASLSRVRNAVPSTWLPQGHLAKCGQLPKSWKKIPPAEVPRLIDAVAVSIPTHCLDGWSFVARAFNALLAGDAHGCRHMAYYAQLRAGLCILANLGVGLFNGINFAVDDAGAVIRIDPSSNQKRGIGTHSIVWSALDEWGKIPAQASKFLELIRIQGNPLKDMLVTLWPGFTATATVGGLIRAWGVDLKRGEDDHSYRNVSSYAAHALNDLPMNVGANLRFVENMWKHFEPSGAAGFDKLDRHLLRRVLLAQHEATNPGAAPVTGPIYSQYAHLPPAIRAMCSINFLLRHEEATEIDIIRYADAQTVPAPPLQMLSRALLLLRTATAFTHTSLNEAGVNVATGELRDWLESFAALRGFCNAATPLADGSGLWDDISVAMNDLNRSRKPAPRDMMSWKSANHNGLPMIAEAERIAVWSLCA